MATTGSKWRYDRPVEGINADLQQTTDAPVAATELSFPPFCQHFLPEHYEANYAYPLLVVFHPHGGNEQQGISCVPQLSRRNFAAISLRGPELLSVREDGQLACGWGHDDRHDELLVNCVLRGVEAMRRACNIHTERVYLLGLCEGAEAAYRVAFRLGESLGGLIALNGALPRPMPGVPLFSPKVLRGLPMFLGHGLENPTVAMEQATRDYKLLDSTGADVVLNRYHCANDLHNDMFRDVNKWVVSQTLVAEGRFSKVS